MNFPRRNDLKYSTPPNQLNLFLACAFFFRFLRDPTFFARSPSLPTEHLQMVYGGTLKVPPIIDDIVDFFSRGGKPPSCMVPTGQGRVKFGSLLPSVYFRILHTLEH